MTLTTEQRIRLAPAFHEAGHAVVGVLFGATIHCAKLVRGGPRTNPRGYGGFCMYDEFDFATEIHGREITAAGTIAEAVLHHGPSPTARQFDALLAKNGSDRADLRRVYFASGGREPMTPTAEVLPLALRCWEPIAKLAVHLDREGEIRHTDVLAALSIPAGSSPDVVTRHGAAIRSDSVPGSFAITPAVESRVAGGAELSPNVASGHPLLTRPAKPGRRSTGRVHDYPRGGVKPGGRV